MNQAVPTDRLERVDAALQAEADAALAAARRQVDEAERASLRLYARLIVEQMMEEGGPFRRLEGDLSQRVEQVFSQGGAFNYVWHSVGKGTLFEQWTARAASQSSRSIFVEVFNEVLAERDASVRLVNRREVIDTVPA